MEIEQKQQQFVAEKLRAGWAKGAIKSAYRREFGSISNVDFQSYVGEAREVLSKAIESDSEMQQALDLYAKWTAIGNIVFAQLRGRERLHKSLGIPSPAEMAGLARDWGTSAAAPRMAVATISQLLQELLASLPGENQGAECLEELALK